MRPLHINHRAVLAGLLVSVALLTVSSRTTVAAPAAPAQPAAGAMGGPVGNLALHGAHPNEDWTTPRLSTSHLHPISPLIAEKDDRKFFTRELVSVGWRPLDSFHLYVIKPKGVTKPPVVLYLYGYNNDTKRFLSDDYCERLTSTGCAAVGFESALTGDRFQMRPMKQWFVSELPESLATSAHDVQMILNYLATRGDLDMTHVGMFGQGSGGAIAVLAAGADPRIKSLDLLNPWGDWPAWLQKTPLIPSSERDPLTTAAFKKKVASLDPVAWLPRLKDRKIRIIQVKDDPTTSPDCQAALAKAAPTGTQVVQYDNNMAMFGGLGHGRLFAWLGSRVKQTGP